MDFEVLYNNYDSGYIVKLDKDRLVMVNIDLEEILEGDEALLMKFGMWQDVTEAPSQEIMEIIAKVLKDKLVP